MKKNLPLCCVFLTLIFICGIAAMPAYAARPTVTLKPNILGSDFYFTPNAIDQLRPSSVQRRFYVDTAGEWTPVYGDINLEFYRWDSINVEYGYVTGYQAPVLFDTSVNMWYVQLPTAWVTMSSTYPSDLENRAFQIHIKDQDDINAETYHYPDQDNEHYYELVSCAPNVATNLDIATAGDGWNIYNKMGLYVDSNTTLPHPFADPVGSMRELYYFWNINSDINSDGFFTSYVLELDAENYVDGNLYDLSLYAASKGGQYLSNPNTIDNLSVGIFHEIDPNNPELQNAITTFVDGNYRIEVPSQDDDHIASNDAADFLVYYYDSTITVTSVELGVNPNETDIFRLDASDVEGALGSALGETLDSSEAKNAWTCTPYPVMLWYDGNNSVNDPNGAVIGTDDGVGPRLVDVSIDDVTGETTACFSEPIQDPDVAGLVDANLLTVNGAVGDGLSGTAMLDDTGYCVIYDALLADGDLVHVSDPNTYSTVYDPAGNPAQMDPNVIAHTVRRLDTVIATDYYDGNYIVEVYYDNNMYGKDDPTPCDGCFNDPNIYAFTFPDGNTVSYPADNTSVEVLGWGDTNVTIKVVYLTDAFTGPDDMPTASITVSDNGQPKGSTGGRFVDANSMTAVDEVGLYIKGAKSFIETEMGQDTNQLLDAGKHHLALLLSETPSSGSVSAEDANDFFQIITGVGGLGTGSTAVNADTFGLFPDYDSSLVLTITLGDRASGAWAIGLDGAVPQVAFLDQNFNDVNGNPVNDYYGALNTNIDDVTPPWITSVVTMDSPSSTGCDGRLSFMELTFDESIMLSQYGDTNTQNSSSASGPALNNASPIIAGPSGPNTLLLTLEEDEFNTDATPSVTLFLDSNNVISETNINDPNNELSQTITIPDSLVTDGACPVIVDTVAYHVDGNSYLFEVYFSEGVSNFDPNSDADALAYFNMPMASSPVAGRWIDTDGSDGVIAFSLDYGTNPDGDSIDANNRAVEITDLSGNADNTLLCGLTCTGPLPIRVDTKENAFDYPYNVGPKGITYAHMDIDGVVADCEGNLLATGTQIQAYRWADLFDPNTGELSLNPARCCGATTVDVENASDGSYAMHIYGEIDEDIDYADQLFNDGEPIVFVAISPDLYGDTGRDPNGIVCVDANTTDYIDFLTGVVPNDPDYYVEWQNCAATGQIIHRNLQNCNEMITVNDGWSLISIGVNKAYYDLTPPSDIDPLIDGNNPTERVDVSLAGSSINNVLFTIRNKWTKIYAFDMVAHPDTYGVKYVTPIPDPEFPLDPTFDITKPDYRIGHFSVGYGYWIHMDTPGTIVLFGDPVKCCDHLRRDNLYVTDTVNGTWNLVGYWGNTIEYMVDTASETIPTMLSTNVKDPLCKEVFFVYPNTMFQGAGAISLRSFVNHYLPSGARIHGAKIWDGTYPDVYDMKYIGPAMGSWVKATGTSLIYDDPNLFDCCMPTP